MLKAGYFVVPRYQRPYSWTQDNVGDFWNDTITSDDGDYFIGAVIVYDADPGDKTTIFNIVDGQQRITTITILLAAIRDCFISLGDLDLAVGVQNYISNTDRRNKTKFVLDTEDRGYPFLHTRVQSMGGTSDVAAKPDERRVEAAYNYFTTQLEGVVKSVESDTTIPQHERPEKAIERIEEIRDRILGLTVIFVSVENEESAYIIFETLNTRGKDLNIADLLRSFLLRDLREQAEGLDRWKDRYNQLLVDLQDPETPLNPDAFILRSWLSRYSLTSKTKLYREIQKVIKTKDDKRLYLQALEEDLPIYRKINFPMQANWPNEQQRLRDSIHATRAIFEMEQPTPTLLSAVRAYEAKNIRLKDLWELAHAIENFHFAYTAVVGRSSSGGISSRYAKAARGFNTTDKDAIRRALGDLKDGLSASAPNEDEFMAAFRELRYSSEYSRERTLVQYVLRREYDRSSEGSISLNYRLMTIEHLAPQNASNGFEQLDHDDYASIGNLILVSEGLNGQLSNKSWAEKRAILASKNELYVDPIILESDEWGPDQIRARANRLGASAFAATGFA
jgi:hypothetical protein